MGCCGSRHTKNYVLIIGSPGSGKSKLCQKLKRNQNSNFSFSEISGMDLEESIEKREIFIHDFQKTYEKKIKNNSSIISLIVSVKFERTDIMKRSLLSVIKYFNRFLDLIIIVVTHFDLSDNKEQDKDDLRKSLKFLLKNNENRIVFSENLDQNDQQLREDLNTIIEDVNQKKLQPFTLKDTIFEKLDESTQQNYLRDLTSQFLNKSL